MKYSKKRLREVLRQCNDVSMPKLKHTLRNELTDWMGERKQIDDILMIGINIAS